MRKVIDFVGRAAETAVELVVFPETFLPGYPFWLTRSGDTGLDDPKQELAYAAYQEAAIELTDPVAGVCGGHRKLVPTFEERPVWGNGHGPRVHQVGGLCRWEHRMPLARHVLYAQVPDLHVSMWPGSTRLTCDITLPWQGRTYSLAAGALINYADFARQLSPYGTRSWRPVRVPPTTVDPRSPGRPADGSSNPSRTRNGSSSR
ncbi:hypothetical protein P3102_21910 [Amycolatopsis sp. QT-25]|uniref:hypothetical protein n=1 Tax=Amycolatopsis sp. QT-25 TaxID=3034022 RepID=UPI0023ED26E7|nr:hypothetical protein [Amycolatopsis sp. QT-25]WET76765.1 hypothetical protein P3102_21910 [Amycolatopsis sp. QT-25]